MTVKGFWKFSKEEKVRKIRVENLRASEVISLLSRNEKLHVDINSAFFSIFERYYLRCSEYDSEKRKESAALSVLERLDHILDKQQCILYTDGIKTAERMRAYRKRLDDKLSTQERLENKIEYFQKEKATKEDFDRLIDLATNMFRISDFVESSFCIKAKQEGWDIVRAEGEAEVHIGRITGAVVVSNDSDMIFYPNVKAVISPRPEGCYFIYKKQTVLDDLKLSQEAFTALGTLSTNDYDDDPFSIVDDDNLLPTEGYVYAQCFRKKYHLMKNILYPIVTQARSSKDDHSSRARSSNPKNNAYRSLATSNTKTSRLSRPSMSNHKGSYHHRHVTYNNNEETALGVRRYIELFLQQMNKKTGKHVCFDDYKRSYRVFVLQQEHLSQYPTKRRHY
ncbi:hypothetical protein BDF20DRAFT_934830 [Mycotypha africana]|uniref:uncharacterized protein n=1 Tax=Mycotypha africana TaxID=64632 RepID=UPI0023011710|nr:uncharacterized protein BDF20DRAFT_934830 [Mycotypha africana]KAI8984332.1 hypothetical protein BDF20DRAFT_934830 [Mycotypha africana]